MSDLSANSRCRCCGHLTLDELDAWEICRICFWEYDPFVTRSPEGRTGANGVPLVEARANYLSFGVSEPRFKSHVRMPTPEEADERIAFLAKASRSSMSLGFANGSRGFPQRQRTESNGKDTRMKPMKPMEPMKPMKPLEPMDFGDPWWPEDLGEPSSSGGQNDMRYAFFPAKQRLLIERDGERTTYDSGDHKITGVSQQNSGSPTFATNDGEVRLDDLRVV